MKRFRVKELMDEQGVSMNALSRGANITINTVRKLVRNDPTYEPYAETLMRVSKFLGVKIDDLYSEEYLNGASNQGQPPQ